MNTNHFNNEINRPWIKQWQRSQSALDI